MRHSRSLSLEHKLPLLMTAVLLVVLAASLVLTYRTLSKSSAAAARKRLTEAVEQVAGSAEVSMRRRARVLGDAARESSLRAALEASRDTSSLCIGPSRAAGRRLTDRLGPPGGALERARRAHRLHRSTGRTKGSDSGSRSAETLRVPWGATSRWRARSDGDRCSSCRCRAHLMRAARAKRGGPVPSLTPDS